MAAAAAVATAAAAADPTVVTGGGDRAAAVEGKCTRAPPPVPPTPVRNFRSLTARREYGSLPNDPSVRLTLRKIYDVGRGEGDVYEMWVAG